MRHKDPSRPVRVRVDDLMSRMSLDEKQGAVFTANTDGSGERRITHPPTGTVDDQPDWSPDGKQIAFERCSDQTSCVAMVVSAQGGKPRRVNM